MVGCAAATLAVLVELTSNLPNALQSLGAGHSWYDVGSLAYWDMTGPLESFAVAETWLLLAAGGRWRRGGLDRPGRPRPRRVLARHPSPALARRTVGRNPRILAIVSLFSHAGGSNPAHEDEEARSCDSPGSGSRSSA